MGIVSLGIAIASLIMMLLLFVFSGKAKGNGGIVYGYLGIGNLALSVAGFVMGLKCFKKDEIYMTTPTAGSVINGMIVIIYLILYFLGAL